VAWFKHNDLPFLHNPVAEPRHFRPGALSQQVKQRILATTTDSTVISLLSEHTDNDEHDYAVFRKKIAQQDTWKQIQIENYLPEFVAKIQQ